METAARSMADISDEEIVFDLVYIFEVENGKPRRIQTFDPLRMFRVARMLARHKPDLLIVSLWRSCVVGILYKLLRPRGKLVVFLHLPDDVHWIDALFTRIALLISSQAWADSKATLAQRASYNKPQRSISFVTQRYTPISRKEPAPVFVFWGRISAQKGLDRALRLFARIRSRHANARFHIIGPDGGAQDSIRKLIGRLALGQSVLLAGERRHDQIAEVAREASFYLQTSLTEGMAISVVEAMQLGLVPIVTPVGEIGNYCRDGENSIVVSEDIKAASQIERLLCSPDRYRDISEAAIATWQDRPLYRDDVMSACRDFLGAAG